MTVELLRARAAPRTDSNFEIVILVSLLGLTVTLALLPMLSIDFGTWLALAG